MDAVAVTERLQIWSLPTELMDNVVGDLDYAGHLALRLTCRRFYNVVRPPLWCPWPTTTKVKPLNFPRHVELEEYLLFELLIIESWGTWKGYLACTECLQLRHRNSFPLGQVRGRRLALRELGGGLLAGTSALTTFIERHWEPKLRRLKYCCDDRLRSAFYDILQPDESAWVVRTGTLTSQQVVRCVRSAGPSKDLASAPRKPMGTVRTTVRSVVG